MGSPDDPKAHRLMGFVLTKLERWEDALHAFDRAHALNPEVMTESSDNWALDNWACAAFMAGQDSRAFTLYERLVRATPDDAEVHAILAQLLHHHKGQLDEAEAEYNDALRLDPHLGRALYGMAYLSLVREDLGGAREWAERLLTVDPEYVDGYGVMCTICSVQGDHEEAEKFLRLALTNDTKDPNRASNLFNIAQMYNRMARELQESDPEKFETYNKRAEINLRHAVELSPYDAEAWLSLGETLADQERMKEAEEMISHALKLDPELQHAEESLAWVRYTIHSDGIEKDFPGYWSELQEPDD